MRLEIGYSKKYEEMCDRICEVGDLEEYYDMVLEKMVFQDKCIWRIVDTRVKASIREANALD